MSVLEGVTLDLQIVLGSTDVPIRQIVKMGRGATIPLGVSHSDLTQVLVNGQLVAKGRVMVSGENLSLEVAEITKKVD